MFFYKLIILLIYALQQTTSLKCYSCGEENPILGPEYPNPLPCDEMDKANDLKDYIIECPDENLSCLTQSKGKEIMRTCDTLPIDDDCKTANGITYCYCTDDLCNGKQSRNDARKSSRDLENNNYLSDDEDYDDDDENLHGIDGSGYKENHNNNNDNLFNENKMHSEIEVRLNRNKSSQNYNIIINIFNLLLFNIIIKIYKILYLRIQL